jgi:HNH endonuclease
MEIMTHWHHIVPRHAGGTDDPENLIELTVSDHAEAHRLLYEKYGRDEDYVAWQGLSGQIKDEHVARKRCSIAGKTSWANKQARGELPGYLLVDTETFRLHRSNAGKVSTNGGSKWWYNGTDYRFVAEQPKGYEPSVAPNNPGKQLAQTYWWNDGVKHKRASSRPGKGWFKGRINNGNLGGKRIKNG